jgi:hypothetical protein
MPTVLRQNRQARALVIVVVAVLAALVTTSLGAIHFALPGGAASLAGGSHLVAWLHIPYNMAWGFVSIVGSWGPFWACLAFAPLCFAVGIASSWIWWIGMAGAAAA